MGKGPHITCVHIPVDLCVFSCLCVNVCSCNACMPEEMCYMHSWVQKCEHLDHVFVYILHCSFLHICINLNVHRDAYMFVYVYTSVFHVFLCWDFCT